MVTTVSYDLGILLKPLNAAHLPLLFAWRSDREVMRYLRSAPIKPVWEDHVAWFSSRPPGRRDWIVEYASSSSPVDGRPIGVVHVTEDNEVGIIIGEKSLWGRGFGERVLKALLTQVFQERACVWCVIHPENIQSQKLFMRVGFKGTGIGRRGQYRYILSRPE